MGTITISCWAAVRDGIATEPLGVVTLVTDGTNKVSADVPDGTKIVSIAGKGAGHNCAIGEAPNALTDPGFHVPEGGERDVRVTKRTSKDLKIAAVAV